LGSWKLPSFTEELAAAICILAWELLAGPEQRGGAGQAIRLFDHIHQTLNQKGLDQLISPGRKRSIRRLSHWSLFIADPNMDKVKSRLKTTGSPVADLLASAEKPAERHNVELQKMMELFRLSSKYHSGADARAKDHFDCCIRPAFFDLSDAVQKHLGNRESNFNLGFTPTTALNLAFNAVITAHHLELPEAPSLVERALWIARRFHQISGEGIMVQELNIESQSARRVLPPELAVLFAPQPPFSEGGKCRLYKIATKLLELVESTRIR
jgi:hypothetical protein